MRKEHKPLFVLRLLAHCNRFYVERFLRPQFDHLGAKPAVAKPRTVQVFGHNIQAGNFLHLISSKQQPVRLTTWSGRNQQGRISIGDYCLIAPGVVINSAVSITLGNNCMLATDVMIADSDWHGIYNRVRPYKCDGEVVLGNNVWVGLRSIIGKGVHIGDNSIIGAGSVVTKSIPANCIAAGNPAKVVKQLDPNKRMVTREYLFNPEVRLGKNIRDYDNNQQQLDEFMFAQNSFSGWLRATLKPTKND